MPCPLKPILFLIGYINSIQLIQIIQPIKERSI